MLVIDQELFERIRTEYVSGGSKPLIERYGKEHWPILSKVLGAHSYEEFEESMDEGL